MKKILSTILVLLCTGALFGCDMDDPKVQDEIKKVTEETQKKVDEANKKAQDKIDDLTKENEGNVKEETVVEGPLTKDSNSEFANMLESADPEVLEAFAKAFRGQEIEFDGAIDLVDFLPNKNTRIEMLMRAGDYNPDTQMGPSFKVKDIGVNDKAVRDLIANNPNLECLNVHITAKVEKYDPNTDLFFIKLVNVTVR